MRLQISDIDRKFFSKEQQDFLNISSAIKYTSVIEIYVLLKLDHFPTHDGENGQ